MVRRTAWMSLLLAVVIALAAGRAAAQAPAPELGKISDEAAGWLADLVRINTTNPPGNELEAARYLKGILDREGIPAELLEVAPGRAAVVARLQSSPVPDPSRALLMLAHLDVVGVSRDKWSVEPFGGIIKNGYLYGRGVIDDKGMVAANLAVLVALKRAGVRLDRDVIFLADTDEEQGGDASIKTLIRNYWDKIAAGFALNEGGNVVVEGGKVKYVGVQAAEKVPVDVQVIATGTSGHASVPRPDNAVVRLAEAIAKIGNYQPPVHMTAITSSYFEQLAKVEDEETAKWMRALEMPVRKDLAARRISDANPVWSSMLRDSIAPTILRAGVRANVVPSEARANLNVRLLPGDSIYTVIGDLQKLVDDPKVRFEAQPDAGEASPPSSLDTPLYLTIERVSKQVFNDTVVVPLMSTWATDSAQLRLRNVQAYGLVPFPLTEQDLLRMHADDERIPLDAFHKGVEYLYRIVEEFAAKK